MTDLFGPWDALLLLLLVVVLCVTGLRWKRQQRRACIKPTQRTRFQQMSDLCADPPELRARYDKPDARWTAPLRRVK